MVRLSHASTVALVIIVKNRCIAHEKKAHMLIENISYPTQFQVEVITLCDYVPRSGMQLITIDTKLLKGR
jgi:hypothetical protein